jgi:hypothetical protein
LELLWNVQYSILLESVSFRAFFVKKICENLNGHSHEKVCEIIPLNSRFGPNYSTPTLFKFLKPFVKKLRLLCGDTLDVIGVHLICQNSQLDARKICMRVAVVRCVLCQSR